MDVSSLRMTDTPEGCRMLLRVRAGARREAIIGARGEALKITVSAAPERGRANRAVLELLARALEWPAGRLRIVSGEASPDKTVLIGGISSKVVRHRLADLQARPWLTRAGV